MRLLFVKYRHVFNVGLQSNIVYRWNFALRAAFSLLHLVFVFVLWGAAFQGHDTIGGFSLDQTLTYFICLLVLQFFIGAFNEDYQISEEIRNGLINQFLLKPINYFLYRFVIFVSARLVSGLLALLPLVIALPLLGDYLTFPDEPWRIAVGIPAAFMSAMIQFTIAYIFGMLTFWFLEIQSFVILSMAIESLLGGQVFPLDLLPDTLFRISQFLPYYYQMYFPAAIFTGRIDQAVAVQGLAIQAFWVVVLLGVANLLWQRGLKRHTAVGG
ncbi:ABC transporter permease [Synoicihabitans lomoniglobus]|uniref:ABC-2 family transporter protein n=1 Tax=Synoicihabitans lomoniglobus TaxID=2909285 RepID=A0AAF0I599_9BACT|nr:ABC-2 family transporter protein [Opitutaceae bacterium LMO-M01]WED66930.1 ABC-2 family transporter protein [Opitutaceae bacterium LMO-M01]